MFGNRHSSKLTVLLLTSRFSPRASGTKMGLIDLSQQVFQPFSPYLSLKANCKVMPMHTQRQNSWIFRNWIKMTERYEADWLRPWRLWRLYFSLMRRKVSMKIVDECGERRSWIIYSLRIFFLSRWKYSPSDCSQHETKPQTEVDHGGKTTRSKNGSHADWWSAKWSRRWDCLSYRWSPKIQR